MMHPTQRAHLDALRRHVERLARRLRRLDRISRRYAWTRLGIVVVGAIVGFAAFRTASDVVGWMVVGSMAIAFFIVAHLHRRVDEGIRRHSFWRRIKEMHAARLTLDWDALSPPAPVTPDADHPFEKDLDLVGPRSLHHLIDTTVSRGGGERLRAWLRQPLLDSDALRARQALVRELVAIPTFRDRLTLYGRLALEDPEAPWDGEALHAWLEQHTPLHRLKSLLLLLSALAVLNAVLFVLFLLTPLPAYWSVSLLVYVGVYLLSYRNVKHVFDDAFHLEKSLCGFRAVAAFLETYRYGPHRRLRSHCAPLLDAERRPSVLLKRVRRIAAAASSQKSEVLLVVLNTLMPWDLFFGLRLARFKEQLRAVLPTWLSAWYDLEALCALATFADLHPGYVFPTFHAGAADMPVFEAERLGHPLLDPERKVCNDFAIRHLGDVVVITGSNMSGKSTFLRTVGINLCLAQAGGPVDATRLQTLPFRLFSAINVSDSVSDGISHFYAEVRRLKRMLEAVRMDAEAPVFFLIDEIFRGTNNRERLLGSRAYVRALVGQRATGLISTHDLELTALADEIDQVHNAHFREEVEARRLVFDYRLRPGPCPTTNALKIMEREGLPVEPTGPPAVEYDTAG